MSDIMAQNDVVINQQIQKEGSKEKPSTKSALAGTVEDPKILALRKNSVVPELTPSRSALIIKPVNTYK
jgi:hypothetical protein